MKFHIRIVFLLIAQRIEYLYIGFYRLENEFEYLYADFSKTFPVT